MARCMRLRTSRPAFAAAARGTRRRRPQAAPTTPRGPPPRRAGPSAEEAGGFRIFKVNAGSPAAEAGLEVFFDFIVEISGVKMAADQSVFFEKIQEAENVGAKLVVHNIRTNTSRDVMVTPRKWGGAGLLGAVVRYDSLESTDNQGIRVLEVFENSPARAAGLVPYKDYLLGTTEVMFRDLDELIDIINLCLGRRMQIYVYNSDTEQIREARSKAAEAVKEYRTKTEAAIAERVKAAAAQRDAKAAQFRSRLENEITAKKEAAEAEIEKRKAAFVKETLAGMAL